MLTTPPPYKKYGEKLGSQHREKKIAVPKMFGAAIGWTLIATLSTLCRHNPLLVFRRTQVACDWISFGNHTHLH